MKRKESTSDEPCIQSSAFLLAFCAASLVSSAVSFAFFDACFLDSWTYSFPDSSASLPTKKKSIIKLIKNNYLLYLLARRLAFKASLATNIQINN